MAKRILTLALLLTLTLALCACAPKDSGSPYTVEKYGATYTVDKKNSTISDGEYTYSYTMTGGYGGYKITITYPNGSTYWSDVNNSGSIITSAGGWSDNYDETKYVRGDILVDVLETKATRQREKGNNIFLAIILMAVGAFNAAVPQAAWFLKYGWRFKNAEPSDLALGINRGIGIAAVVIGLIMLII